MSSTHFMAHQLRVPPSSSAAAAVLITFTHLIICHVVATVSPSSANHSHPNASFVQSSSQWVAGPERDRLRTGATSERNQSMLVITNDDDTDIEQSFREYQDSFHVPLDRAVDFVRGDGLSTLLWQAENPKYSTVLYVLSGSNSDDAELCDMSGSMSQSFNKTIIFWPCPKMKHAEESASLPSYETISFAVKSISQEFNWTEAVIFVAGTNWGLPLAIAANLHIPYRIELNQSYAGEIEDKLGAVVIVTSPVNSVDFRRLLHEFRAVVYTKVLVIDTTGAIFSRRNHFSGYLATKEELDFVVEHWSGDNFYSAPSTPLKESGHHENDREKRAAEEQQRPATKVPSEEFRREEEEEEVVVTPETITETEAAAAAEVEALPNANSSSKHNTPESATPKRPDPKVFAVDPKPQSFLVLTVLTDKFKTLHDRALYEEFEQHSKTSQWSGVAKHEGDQSDRSSSESGEGGGERDVNGNSEDSYQVGTKQKQRKQMKRSEEIIVTVNGTRNCNTTTVAKHAASSSDAGAGNGPKSGESRTSDCEQDEEYNSSSSSISEGRPYEGDASRRLLINKLPIFTSLTSSINESIQLLLSYLKEHNCSLSATEGGSSAAPPHPQNCVSALKCSSVTDGDEQLFCNYLCGLMTNNYVANAGGGGGRGRETRVGSEVKSNRLDSFNVSQDNVKDGGEPRRFATQSEVVAAAERVCLQQAAEAEAAATRDQEPGSGIQMQFSESLLYFYNENVVSKNNELVKRHKSKPMPNQNQQSHYPAKDHSFPNGPSAVPSPTHRLLKRNAHHSALLAKEEDNRSAMDDGAQREEEEPDNVRVTVTVGHRKGASAAAAAAASHYAKYSEYFSLFDYIVAAAGARRSVTAGAQVDFILLDFQSISITNDADNGTGLGWRPFLIMQQSLQNPQVFTTHSILPGYNDWTLIPTQNFMECGLLCLGVIVLAIVILCSIFVGGIVSALTIRKYLLKKRLSKGPNKVVLSTVDFVFPVDSRRVDEGIEAMLCCFLQQLQEFGGPEVEKPDVVKGSISSLKTAGLPAAQKNNSGSGSLARHNTVLDMRARYNGDLVQLKEISLLMGTELKTKAMDLLVMSHGLRHENINPFIGWLSDPTRTAMVFEYCSRGSLQDVLIMDDIKLDWSFRLSLLTDLVRGMRYLHSSPLRVHGGLTSRNCVVDARWVLKITDYGMSSFYDTIGITPPAKSAKELLWTAPEALRNTKGFPKCGTQMGDVYSFGIIMQEVVVRGEPYCMLSLSPEEIIQKIKKPPPLIRPSVSKGAAPPEAINIMRQCWAEMPDMRPDFNTVYERFKQLNHGRKVNFVDTMFQMLEKYSNNLEELIRERTDQLDMERKKTEQLLNRMLPTTVAEKLKVGLGVEPEEFSEVTIYFSDIVGFTTIAAHCSPVQVVDLLNDLYTCFDATINAYNVYKVETIGDAYMVVSGLPSRIPDHAEQIATMALDLLHESGRFQVKHLPGVPLQLRIGLHSGPCCAGVVGLTMPRYCLFGDTVNTASRMESTGSSWRIHMSQSTCDRLVRAGGYYIDSRGLIEIKGKGMMNTYWLLGKKGFDKPLPDPPPIGESHGLDESLIRNSIKTSQILPDLSTPSSPSSNGELNLNRAAAAGATATKYDIVEVKVEITPPVMSTADLQQQQQQLQAHQPHHSTTFAEHTSPVIATSASLDSPAAGQATLGFSQQDFPPRASVSLASPGQRKMSEFSQDSLLNPNGFTRMTPSPGANSSRLFKKIEEMMDLSSPYNHYRCLSSDSSIIQCGGNMLGMGSMLQSLAALGGNLSAPAPPPPTVTNPFTSLTIPEQQQQSVDGKLNSSTVGAETAGSRPGSGRLLRRQFSLDKEEGSNSHAATSFSSSSSAAPTTLTNNLGNSACLQTNSSVSGGSGGGAGKSYAETLLPADTYQKHSSLPSISGQTVIQNNNNNNVKQPPNRTALFKHNSSSMSQDLEKIEENPASPNSIAFHHQPCPPSNHTSVGLYSQSSLTSSIPFIDGSSCGSSVSTIPGSSSAAGGAAAAGMGGSTSSGVHKLLEARDSRHSQESEVEGEGLAERREMNLNVDPLLLR